MDEAERLLNEAPIWLEERSRRLLGCKAKEWFEVLPQLLSSCIMRWELFSCSMSKKPSLNLICFALSPSYGEVALKIGAPCLEIFNEMEAIPLFREGSICQLYETHRESKALLLERILPGRDLWSVNDRSRRLEIGAELLPCSPVPLEDPTGIFPHYQELLQKAFQRARDEGRLEESLLSLLDKGEKMMEALLKEDGKKYLLHGDLHHCNLLEGQKGQWIAIDPKGIIGPLAMEVGPFMKNELFF